jgi:hypothetical protein
MIAIDCGVCAHALNGRSVEVAIAAKLQEVFFAAAT